MSSTTMTTRTKTRLSTYVDRLSQKNMRKIRRAFAPIFFRAMLCDAPSDAMESFLALAKKLCAEVRWVSHSMYTCIGTERCVAVFIHLPKYGLRVYLTSKTDPLGLSNENTVSVDARKQKQKAGVTWSRDAYPLTPNLSGAEMISILLPCFDGVTSEPTKTRLLDACLLLLTSVRIGQWLDDLPSDVTVTGNWTDVVQ